MRSSLVCLSYIPLRSTMDGFSITPSRAVPCISRLASAWDTARSPGPILMKPGLCLSLGQCYILNGHNPGRERYAAG